MFGVAVRALFVLWAGAVFVSADSLAKLAGNRDLACSACDQISRALALKSKVAFRKLEKAKANPSVSKLQTAFDNAAKDAQKTLFNKKWYVRTVDGKDTFTQGMSKIPDAMKEGMIKRGYDF